MAFHNDPRVTGLAAIAGLVVAYIRNVLQYHRYSWDSLWEFLGWWFIHYIAVILVVGITYAFTRGKPSLLLGTHESLHKLTLEEGMIYGSILVIVAAIAILLIAHWPVGIND